MQGGALQQKVAIHGGGEIATLATAFNTVSEELGQSHEALQQYNQTILEQADRLKEMSIRDALADLYNRATLTSRRNRYLGQTVCCTVPRSRAATGCALHEMTCSPRDI